MNTKSPSSSWTPPRLYTERLYLASLDGGEEVKEGECDIDFSLKEGLPSNWTLLLTESDESIGTIGFIRRAPDSQLAELGFLLSHRYRQRGLMTEACFAVLAFGFRQMALDVVEARVRPENVASLALLKKLGMKKEGQCVARVSSKGPEIDLDVYRLSAQVFSEVVSQSSGRGKA